MVIYFKKWIVSLLPLRIRRWLFHPMIVSNSYREEVDVTESVLLMRHDGANLDSEFWAAMLRKYCHILDKGLQRHDCESGHSKDFYALALEARDKITEKNVLDDPSVLWAKNKIIEYEEFQGKTCWKSEGTRFAPSICTYDQLCDVVQSRRSVRIFQERTVERTDIERIASVINWAPTSCNRQTSKIFIADSPKSVEECLHSNSGATCLSDNVPCFMSFCVDLRPYDMPHEMTLPIIDSALGIQNCCLAAHSLGIGLTILNWTHHSSVQDKQLRKVLGIPSYYRIVANAVLGYPAVGAPIPARKRSEATCVFSEEIE